MTKLPPKTIAGIATLLFAVAAPWLLTSYDLNLLGRFLALSLTAMGLVLLWGEGGVLSLGQGVFFGLGGYALAMHLKLDGLGTGDRRHGNSHRAERREHIGKLLHGVLSSHGEMKTTGAEERSAGTARVF